MVKVSVLGSEYVIVPANNISSWCISRRGTIFTWGADIVQSKFSDNNVSHIIYISASKF
jgi:hypothetical protein